MPTSLDTKIRPKVKEILASYGKDVTVQTLSVREYDPTTGDTEESGEEAHVVKASPPWPVDLKYFDETTVEVGDAMIIIAAKDLPFTPANRQRVTIDSRKWHVVRHVPVYSGEQVAAYMLHIRAM